MPFNPASPNTFEGDFTHKSQAVFAELTYHFPSLEGLSFTAGGRWTRDDRKFNAHHNDGGGCTLSLVAGGPELPADQCNFKDSDTWAEPTYNFTLQYQVNDDTQMYLAHRHGYRAGAYNLRGTDGPTIEPFNQETVTDLEFGLKTDFDLGDVSMRTNLSAFYTLYDDIQRSIIRIIPGTGSLQTVITNAAEADIWGGELEVTAQTDRLTWRSALGVAVGRYKEYKTFTGDLKGEPIGGTPNWTLSTSIRYQLPTEELFGGLLGRMALQLDYVRYEDFQVGAAAPAFGIPSRNATYYLMNARLDWSPGDGDYEIGIWMKNILDRYYETGTVGFQPTFGYNTLYLGDPRLWGVDITYRF